MNFVTKREEIIIHLKGRKLMILYIVIIALSLDHFRCNKMRFFFFHMYFFFEIDATFTGNSVTVFENYVGNRNKNERFAI